MANICDTQYKVTGSRKAVADLWNTLQELEVNSNNVYLYLLAEHYGIDYEKTLNKEQVVVLEIAECTEMEIQQNRHDFTVGQRCRTPSTLHSAIVFK